MQKLMKKEHQLQDILQKMGKAVLGFSGGVDSTYLLDVAKDIVGLDVLAVTFTSELHLDNERAFATSFGHQHTLKHRVEKISPLAFEEIRRNEADRCYHCKRIIFGRLVEIAHTRGYDVVIDGTNIDDFSDYRPGLKACFELGVRHPLAEADLNKEEIRTLSRLRNLPTANKPAFACLASRVPYGMPLNAKTLEQIEAAEQVLADLGFQQYRVRHHGNLARLEVLAEDLERMADDKLRQHIVSALERLGYTYVTLDLKGYTMGSLNLALDKL